VVLECALGLPPEPRHVSERGAGNAGDGAARGTEGGPLPVHMPFIATRDGPRSSAVAKQRGTAAAVAPYYRAARFGAVPNT
jgi:hypothetical protein